MKASLLKFFCVAIVLIAYDRPAAAATYSIDPTSALDLSGKVNVDITLATPTPIVVSGTGDVEEQVTNAGGLRSTLSGSINANAAGGVLTFPGGSSITALPSGNWDPKQVPAAFGFKISVPLSAPGIPDVGTMSLFGDIRDLAFDVSGAAPLTGNTFDPLGLTLITKSGTLDMQGFFCAPGETDLTQCDKLGTTSSGVDDGGPPDLLPSGTGSFTGHSLSLSLVLSNPGDETDTSTVNFQGIPIQVTTHITGTFDVAGNVSAALIPEPSVWFALCVGLLGCAVVARSPRARRRSLPMA